MNGSIPPWPKPRNYAPFVERLITVAKRGLAESVDSNRALHARRLVRRDLVDREVATKLFETIAPRFEERPGGYTRLLRVGRRHGDDAELAQVELVGSEYTPETEAPTSDETEATPKAKGGVGRRIRMAAQRIRGGSKGGEPVQADVQSQKGRLEAYPQENLGH